MTYDTAIVDDLGAERTKLTARLREVNRSIENEWAKARAADFPAADFSRRSGVSRETLDQWKLPADQRWRRQRQAAAARRVTHTTRRRSAA